jgi:hypothetical protein
MVLLCKRKEECWCRRGEGDVVYKYGFGVCLVSGVSIILSVVGEGEGAPGCTKSCSTFLVSGATPRM